LKQFVYPAGQHTPPEQFPVHTLPHVPQLAGSASRFAQAVPQSVGYGASQRQVPLAQVEPGFSAAQA
jgi:hypothetical protein